MTPDALAEAIALIEESRDSHQGYLDHLDSGGTWQGWLDDVGEIEASREFHALCIDEYERVLDVLTRCRCHSDTL